jgi:hypothetical protein
LHPMQNSTNSATSSRRLPISLRATTTGFDQSGRRAAAGSARPPPASPAGTGAPSGRSGPGCASSASAGTIRLSRLEALCAYFPWRGFAVRRQCLNHRCRAAIGEAGAAASGIKHASFLYEPGMLELQGPFAGPCVLLPDLRCPGGVDSRAAVAVGGVRCRYSGGLVRAA